MRTRILTHPVLVAAISAATATFFMVLIARPAAAAAAGCQFDAATAKVTIDYSGPGTVARVKRGPNGTILVDGAACGAATVTNTDTIVAKGGSGRQQLIIDLSGGAFSPGKTSEGASISEIEFQVDAGNGGEFPLGDDVTVSGRSVADTIRFGGTGILLDGDVDPDVTTANVETLTALGNGGDDHLLGSGDGAGGPAASLPLLLSGGDGNDELVGGNVKDTLDGGNGNDTESGAGDADTIKEGTAPNGADVLDGGASPFDRIEYAGRTSGVRIDLNDNADDGAPGEGDNVKDTFEYIVGGAGDDAIVASQTRYQPFDITANEGNDHLTGGSNYDNLDGGAGNDEIDGMGGSDTFRAGDGNDIERGGEGADQFQESLTTGPNGADDIQGGAGVDEFYAGDRTGAMTIRLDDVANDGSSGEGDNVHSDVEKVTTGKGNDNIYGSSAANALTGGNGNDNLKGGGGDDTLSGYAGNDVIRGDAGADTAYGDDGTDDVDGGADADTVRGGAGNDRMGGGTGNDRVYGDGGDDVLAEPGSRDGADQLTGGDGTDEITYAARTKPVTVTLDGAANDGSPTPTTEGDNADAEKVTGGSAADHLTGSAGSDVLDGGPANDIVEGQGGNDRLLGGDGGDSISGGMDDDTLDGGSGPDRLAGDAGADVADYSGRTEPLQITVGGGADDGAAGEGDDVQTDNVIGGTGADRITGDGADNRLDGSAGDDVLDGAGGADDLVGGDGTDTASYATRSARTLVKIDGSANDGADADNDGFAEEQDNVETTVENVTGGSGSDWLVGGNGDNTLAGGPGDDRLDGAGGADVLDGQEGRDTADYGTRDVAVTVTVGDDAANDGTDADGNGTSEEHDNVTGTIEVVQGGKASDRLTGGPGSERLDGSWGNDVLDGGPGGDDVLSGGEGTHDTASYAQRSATDPVSVTLDDGANDGKRDGSEHDNVMSDVEDLVGGSGDDELHGSSRENVIDGGPGKDALYGEGGDDRFDQGTDPADWASDADQLWGGAGRDLADYSRRTTALRVSIDDAADDGAASTTSGDMEGDNVHTDVEDVTAGSGSDQLYGSAIPNRLDGGNGVNRIEGGGAADVLVGGDSVDRIYGQGGDDKIYGGASNNVLNGGYDDDTFYESASFLGNDQFIGGPGGDTVDYSPRSIPVVLDNDGSSGDDGQDANRDGNSEEHDTIGTDVESMTGGGAADRITNAADTPDRCATLHGGAGDDIVTGGGHDETLFGDEGNDQLDAGDGYDTLVGGAGADVEKGGSGDDDFVEGKLYANCDGKVYDDAIAGDGPDILDGGSGTDTVDYRRAAVSPVNVTLDGVANDGSTAEHDNAMVENVFGTRGNDTIVGDGGDNWLVGEEGDDHVDGAGGDDRLGDVGGIDTLLGGSGSDVFETDDGDNADTLNGGSGDDSGTWDDGDTRTDVP